MGIANTRMKEIMNTFKSEGLKVGESVSIEKVQRTIALIVGHTQVTKQLYVTSLMDFGYLKPNAYGGFEIKKFE